MSKNSGPLQIVQVILWTLVGLALLQNFGFNVSALLGGLGIGGIAVAFAVQNILGDLFSSVSLYFDKPFKVGDFIEVGEESGTVKKIGLKTTRLETILGDQLIISNKDLTEQSIHNYQRIQRRQVIFTLPIDVRTSAKQRQQLIAELDTAFADIKLVSYSDTYLKNITATALEYSIAYFVESSDYIVYLQVHHQVNERILQILSRLKIELPFGKQEVLVQN